MMKAFNFLVFVFIAAIIIGALVWLYGENQAFQMQVDETWNNFIRLFTEKLPL